MVITGHLIVAAALSMTVWAKKPYPDLLLCRLAFSLGASALTMSISAIIGAMSPIQSDAKRTRSSEEEPLISRETVELTEPVKTGRLAGYVGLASGVGALLAGRAGLFVCTIGQV